MTALAKRVVACRGWDWDSPLLDGCAWESESGDYPRFGRRIMGEFWEFEDVSPCSPPDALPDLDDHATLGCFDRIR